MKWFRIVSIALGGLLAVLIFLVVIGVPAQVLVVSLSRQVEASTGLRLHVAGFAKLAVLPELGLTLEDVAIEDAASGRSVFSAKRVRYGIALSSLARGQVRVTEIALTQSTLRLGRWPTGPARAPGAARPTDGAAPHGENLAQIFALEQLSADDCTLIVDDGRERAELKLDSVRLNSSLSPSNDRLSLTIDARSGANTVQVKGTVDSPALLLEEKPARIEAAIETSGAVPSTATVKANVQFAGPVVRMDAIEGTFARGRVGGSVSVSFARAKPFVDANIDVERLDLTDLAPPARPARVGATTADPGAGAKPAANNGARWSDRPIGVTGLRMVELNAQIAAREIVLDKVHLGPANLEATLLEDKLSIVLPDSQLYGGRGTGELTIDAAKQVPALSLRFDLAGVNVLPILSDAANFDHVDGRGGMKFDLQASGESPLQIVSGLEGTASFQFEDGELRGINVPHMLQSLLETIMSGWQANASDRTKFSTFGASFRIKDGQARTDDLRFAGPFVRVTATGTANLIEQTMDFRLDPKLVTSPGAQTSGAESWSIGVQVLAQGPWSNPQIYADLPGILKDPAAALGKLRMGEKGLPGLSGGGGADNLLKTLDGLMGGRGGNLGDQLKRLQPPR
jgi:AsmA protein